MMKQLIPMLLLLSIGCSNKHNSTTIDGFALGTIYSITIVSDLPQDLNTKLNSLFVQADNSMSIFNPNSLLSRLNRNETDSVDIHIARCVEIARRVSELSCGAYDITVLPLIEAYGFASKDVGVSINTDSLLQYVGYQKIQINNGRLIKERPQVRIDLNSVAKGYIVDLVAGLLESEGVGEYLVNIGGEIFCRGKNAKEHDWVIGIETPVEGNFIEGASTECSITVSDVGVATSGNYRNFHITESGEKVTHIIDPRTGHSTSSALLSATVVAASCAEADAMGTMLIALGVDEARQFLNEHPDIAALIIVADKKTGMSIEHSRSMKRFIRKES